ncbi:MAG: ABC-type antimicrobial peptide transport system, permease component [Patescibacteria group bacterium]|nr:ABC-type antimicrobial peptide transport system, permease component [Patescibacteria group bacterium]
MLFWENLKMALVSLMNAKLRSLLTMLGIIIGVAAVVSILAIGAGVKKAVQDQITGVVNANAVAVASGKINVGKTSGGQGAASSLGASTLTPADIAALAKVKHVTAVAPISLVSGIMAHGAITANGALLLATTPDFSKTQTLKFTGGRFLESADSGKKVVVLGGQAKQDLFGDASAIGQTVTIRGLPFTVIGSIKASDSGASSLTGSSFDNAAYLPFETAKTFAGGTTPQILRLIAQADAADNVTAVAADAKKALLKSHGGQDDFTVLTQKDILSTVDTVLNLLTTFIVAIASISLLVGGIGIMNIMLVSVTERTREIGLRKAIGASSFTVLSQFLIEAVVLSIIGGALGILVAVALATVAGKLAHITPVFTPNAIMLAVGVSAAVGIIFGIMPAIKAARKRPIQALKAE